MDIGISIQIQNKMGRIVTVPLKTWENGLNKDENWHIYEPPKPKVQPVAPVKVVIKPVPPIAPAAKPVAQATKPTVRRTAKPGRKPKGK